MRAPSPDAVDEAPGEFLVDHQIRDEAGGERAAQARELLRTGRDAHPTRDFDQTIEPRTGAARVESDVPPAAVCAIEDGGDVADDALGAETLVVGSVEVAADVDATRHLGERRAETEDGDIHPGDEIEDPPRRPFLPQGFLGARAVEEGGYRELLHSCRVRPA